jgi:hypothetical protein
MRSTKQTIVCLGHGEPICESSISIEVTGTHDLRSTSTALEDLAVDAGWKDGRCPAHRHGMPDRYHRVKQ